MIDFSKIKLVIWDLDDTFWQGILSEGGILDCKNIDIITTLTDCGIVNAVCSKNDRDIAEEKLRDLGVSHLFVFNSIDWTPKGPRIKNMIEDMGLRSENVLFIDDNIVNLNEAKHYTPNIMTATPEIINGLRHHFEKQEKKDIKHKRLEQYKVLQNKQETKKEYSDNFSFLLSTKTQVVIHHDCINQIDRIHELLLRTNQLNFTKIRSSRDELIALVNDSSVKSGYVTVSDSFGDYGIVGFFAMKENVLIHFLFSCRTIGQGVEQWVYAQLGYPQLNVVGRVINNVDDSPAPSWINQNESATKESMDEKKKVDSIKILMKGPCDLSILTSYLVVPNIICEFTYQGKNNNSIEHHNHSINYLSFPFLSKSNRQELLDDCIFNDKRMFDTSMYDDNVQLIFLSAQTDPNLGIYRNKKSGMKLAFAEHSYPLTDKQFWSQYINKEVCTYENEFTEEFLRKFSNNYEFLGQITPEVYVNNIKTLLTKIGKKTVLCLLLGSEIPYLKNTQLAYENREKYNIEVNALLRDLAKHEPRLRLISFGDFVNRQDDFLDNINHYKRHVYYKAAKEANLIIHEVTGLQSQRISRINLVMDEFASLFRYSKFRNNLLFKLSRGLYHKLRD